MEILELKHLSPYLPYGLKFVSHLDEIENYPKRNKLWTLDGISKLFGDYCLNTLENSDAYPIKTIKPILKPLSDLSNEDLRLAMYNLKHYSHIDWTTIEREKLIEDRGFDGWFKDIPYVIVNYLFENHYDVFRLIDKKLAISK